MMTWKLIAISDELHGQELTVDRDMLVGRHQDADIQLQSAEISRRHAAFLLKEDALWVQDLKSSNGTFVNDLRIEHEKLLKDGDIVQFASIKFNVLAPAKAVELESVTPLVEVEEPVEVDVPVAVETIIQQPAEAIATAEIKPLTPESKIAETQTPVAPIEPMLEKTVAEKMNEQGMPALTERDQNVQLTANGMPTNMSVPKPAPIPQGVDIHAPPEACDVSIPEVCVTEEAETQKNAKVGLITIVTLVILAILAWLFFK